MNFVKDIWFIHMDKGLRLLRRRVHHSNDNDMILVTLSTTSTQECKVNVVGKQTTWQLDIRLLSDHKSWRLMRKIIFRTDVQQTVSRCHVSGYAVDICILPLPGGVHVHCPVHVRATLAASDICITLQNRWTCCKLQRSVIDRLTQLSCGNFRCRIVLLPGCFLQTGEC
jgi:hypothetical protein